MRRSWLHCGSRAGHRAVWPALRARCRQGHTRQRPPRQRPAKSEQTQQTSVQCCATAEATSPTKPEPQQPHPSRPRWPPEPEPAAAPAPGGVRGATCGARAGRGRPAGQGLRNCCPTGPDSSYAAQQPSCCCRSCCYADRALIGPVSGRFAARPSLTRLSGVPRTSSRVRVGLRLLAQTITTPQPSRVVSDSQRLTEHPHVNTALKRHHPARWPPTLSTYTVTATAFLSVRMRSSDPGGVVRYSNTRAVQPSNDLGVRWRHCKCKRVAATTIPRTPSRTLPHKQPARRTADTTDTALHRIKSSRRPPAVERTR